MSMLWTYSLPPYTAPFVDRLPGPPNTAADFQVPNMIYMTSLTAVCQYEYRRYFASPESGGIGGSTVVYIVTVTLKVPQLALSSG